MDAALLERIVVDFRVFEVNPAKLAEIIQMVAVANDISDEEAFGILNILISGYMDQRTKEGKRKILEEIKANADATLKKLKGEDIEGK